MPYMKVSLTQKLTEEKRKELVDGLGKALGIIPGKDGSMLIADLEEGRTMYVGGKRQEAFAFIDVRYYSRFEYHIKKKFTKAVFDAIHRVLGIAYENMSLNIAELSSWGGFGDFKDEFYSD
ncbi:MAG: hypothetical protein GX254_01760 [Clostridiales bacterium]|nr:hypothetical protein [Clostridiales bacterium]